MAALLFQINCFNVPKRNKNTTGGIYLFIIRKESMDLSIQTNKIKVSKRNQYADLQNDTYLVASDVTPSLLVAPLG